MSLPYVLVICYDNLSAECLAKNHVLHYRTKHTEIDFHFVRKNVEKGKLVVQRISSEDQILDVMTMALPSLQF